MSKFDVDSVRIAEGSAKVAATATALRSEVATMKTNLASMGEAWHGSAATAFVGVMSQWHSAQLQMETSLDSITSLLSTAASTYAEAEAAASKLFAM